MAEKSGRLLATNDEPPCADPESSVRGDPTLIGSDAQKPTKSGQLLAFSETPLKWRFAGGPIMAHIECWLGRFVIFRESEPLLLGNPINL